MPTNCERMTVKQVAEKVYGPIPDGATLHIGYGDCMGGRNIHLTVDIKNPRTDETTIFKTRVWLSGIPFKEIKPRWLKGQTVEYVDGPDISDRPASSFVGFFGKEFDEAVLEFRTNVLES